jgi:hypothetical protein
MMPGHRAQDTRALIQAAWACCLQARDSNGFDLEGRLAMALKELRVTKDGLRWAQVLL